MARNQKKRAQKTIHVIPQYRDEIDVQKLCTALIMAAKDKAREKNNTGT